MIDWGRDELSDRRDRQPARVLVQGDRDGGFGGDRAARAGGAGGRDRLRLVAQRRALLRGPARGRGPGRDRRLPASEVPAARRYDRLVYISRTGTTTEVLDALRAAPRDTLATAITADPDAPLAREARHVILLDFADERSVVSSRFITSSIVLLRAQLGTGIRSRLRGRA